MSCFSVVAYHAHSATFSPGLAGVIFLAAKGLAKHYYRMCKGEAMARRRVLSFHQT